MGAGQSGGHEIDGSSMGYQVLRVYPNSPGSQAGLKAYFDFIVAIGNTRFNKEDGSLREILKASVDQKLKMIVYNTRNKQPREVDIVPTTSWGGSGLLGVSIKHSSFDKADERVWHVVEVDPGSPAHQAGLKPGEDFVIGSDSILQESDDLYNLIEAHEGKALKLFVYNSISDNCREVICHPNSRWGGRGFLGCEFGHGLLHRIPYGDDKNTGGDTKTTSQSKPLPPIQQQHQQPQQQQPQQQLSQPHQTSNYGRPQTIAQQQQQHQLGQNSQLPLQPGHHLFQQALFSHNSGSSSLQQQQPARQSNAVSQSTNSLPPPSQMLIGAKAQPESGSLPPFPPQPPQAPQTFAQLASAQTKQDQQYHYQQQQQPDQLQHQLQQQPSNLQYQAPQQQPSPQQLPQQQFPYQPNSTANVTNGPNIGASGFMPSQFPLANTWAPMMAPNNQPPAPPQSGQSVAQSMAANSFQMGSTDSVSAPPRPPMIAHTFAQLAEAQSHQPNPTPNSSHQTADQTQLPEQTFHQQQFFQQQQQQQSQPPHYQP